MDQLLSVCRHWRHAVCIEVGNKKTQWTVPDSRRWYNSNHCRPLATCATVIAKESDVGNFYWVAWFCNLDHKWQRMEDMKAMWCRVLSAKGLSVIKYGHWTLCSALINSNEKLPNMVTYIKSSRVTAKRCSYEKVIVPTAPYGPETLGMKRAEKNSEFTWDEWLRSLVGVSRMDIVLGMKCGI